MKQSLAGCVILYNPTDEVERNVASYIDELELLYVVDNGNGRALIERLREHYREKLQPLYHEENRGIAASLNEVLRLADGRFTHLLTMDQDSRFYEDSMARYKAELSNFDWRSTLGIGPKTVRYDFVQTARTKVAWGGANV